MPRFKNASETDYFKFGLHMASGSTFDVPETLEPRKMKWVTDHMEAVVKAPAKKPEPPAPAPKKPEPKPPAPRPVPKTNAETIASLSPEPAPGKEPTIDDIFPKAKSVGRPAKT